MEPKKIMMLSSGSNEESLRQIIAHKSQLSEHGQRAYTPINATYGRGSPMPSSLSRSSSSFQIAEDDDLESLVASQMKRT